MTNPTRLKGNGHRSTAPVAIAVASIGTVTARANQRNLEARAPMDAHLLHLNRSTRRTPTTPAPPFMGKSRAPLYSSLFHRRDEHCAREVLIPAASLSLFSAVQTPNTSLL
eukprot:6186968-Pleurochrysis_carterae.AAC.5